ncbi:hypothetical protein KIS1582_2043 [Cytobacillus firmus]|uniref:Uncharacterized protein n=1 Tax=Cytobacillus firmus TaxID=1399 RepID=A0A800MX55_CYTFI|nr:hypothetical protein KIS1582_2043 [Cytobacillus firmus]
MKKKGEIRGWGLEPQGFEGSERENRAGKDFLGNKLGMPA